jgi:hypothetical protein
MGALRQCVCVFTSTVECVSRTLRIKAVSHLLGTLLEGGWFSLSKGTAQSVFPIFCQIRLIRVAAECAERRNFEQNYERSSLRDQSGSARECADRRTKTAIELVVQ